MRRIGVCIAGVSLLLLAACGGSNPPVTQAPHYEFVVTLDDQNGNPLNNYTVCIGQKPLQACGMTDVNGNADIDVSKLPAGQYDYWVFNPGAHTTPDCVRQGGLGGGRCSTVTLQPGVRPSPETVTHDVPPPPTPTPEPTPTPPPPGGATTGYYWTCNTNTTDGGVQFIPPNSWGSPDPFCEAHVSTAGLPQGTHVYRVEVGSFEEFSACNGGTVANIINPTGSQSTPEYWPAYQEFLFDADWNQLPGTC